MIDVATNKVLTTIKTGESPHHVAVSPDGRLIYAADLCGDSWRVTYRPRQIGNPASILQLTGNNCPYVGGKAMVELLGKSSPV